uniref:Uncharacterized protein n=1 Tax=Oryza brachyantha TaxID=4533 RepID=J3MM07_ORYBR
SRRHPSSTTGATRPGGRPYSTVAAAASRAPERVRGDGVRVVGGERARPGGDPRGVRGGVGAGGDGPHVDLRLRLRQLQRQRRRRRLPLRRRRRDDRDRAGGGQPHRDRHLQVPVMDCLPILPGQSL